MAIDFPNAASPGATFTANLKTWTFTGGKWVLNVSTGGVTGATGPTGPAGTITVGTVTGGATGVVTNVGTTTNATLNFTLPIGATGLTGPTGVTGAVGPTGLTGATGPQGAASTVAGPAGGVGATGATGPAGTNGTNGTNGAQGPAGSTSYDAGTLNGYASQINGTANTIARLDGSGILAATYFGMGINNQTYWYATDYYGGTVFRATNSTVWGQAISSGRAVMVNSNGTIGTVASSRRYKENIIPYVDEDNKVLTVSPVTFDYIEGKLEEDQEENRFNRFGMIAEDLHNAGLHHLVHYNAEEQPEAVNYELLSVELLGVIRNLNTRLEILEQNT
jgi:hypothetical protein